MAHNRYREAQPSGENTIVDAEIAQLTAAGVDPGARGESLTVEQFAAIAASAPDAHGGEQ